MQMWYSIRYHVSETPMTHYSTAASSYYSAPSYAATASYQSSIPTYSTAYGYYEEPVYYTSTTNAYYSHHTNAVPQVSYYSSANSLSSYSVSSTTAPFYYVELMQKSYSSAPSASYTTEAPEYYVRQTVY